MPTYRFIADPTSDNDETVAKLEFASDAEAMKEAQRALADDVRDALPGGNRIETKMEVEAEGRGRIYRTRLIFSGEHLSPDNARARSPHNPITEMFNRLSGAGRK